MRTPTVGKIFDAVEVRNMGDVDEPFWPADVSLHQVQKIGAGSKISGARFGSGFNGLAYCRRPHIIKASHATSWRFAASSAFCAFSTASVMP